MRRISLWLGVGALLSLLALIGSVSLSTTAAQPLHAFQPGLNQAQTKGATEDPTLKRLQEQGVPLRNNWWQFVPDIDPATKLNKALLQQFQSNPDQEQGFMVYLKAQADTSNTITDWNAKGEYVLRQLETVANATQPALMNAIAQQRMAGRVSKAMGFTIINAVFVRGNMQAALELAGRSDVAFIDPDHRYYPLNDGQTVSASIAGASANASAASSPNTVEPGVQAVHAPQVWALGYRGQGVVVGHIDTGVDYLHPALVRQYRGNLGGGNFDHNYNWWDARADQPGQNVPYDDDGHGTHTIGTVLGEDQSQTNQIGVAPGAKFISAKVFPNGGSSGNEEITPAEDFMLAPWDLNHQNRRPDLRPNIVTNSWGDNECWNTDSWLVTLAWIDAGIMPTFANGNAGPTAGSVGSPGGYPFLLGIGAVSAPSPDPSTWTIASFSSRGPSCWGGVIKPDVVAPGVNVRSSLPGGSYGSLSGTSMATPHSAGVMALVLSANPNLTYVDMMGILTRTAYFRSVWGTRPNNNYGWGMIQADAAVDMALHGPHLSGTVTSGSNNLAGATITAVRSDGDTYTAQTRANGTYSMTLLAGTYTVTASLFGYNPVTLTGQNFMTDTNPVLNFNLTALPTYQVSGQLLMFGSCTPISGTINITPPGWLTVTAPSGSYNVNLPAGNYTFVARAGAAMQPITQTVTVSGNTVQNFTFGPAHDNANTYHVERLQSYTWISGTTQLTFDDPHDGYSAVTLPFPFTYYGNTYTTMNVSTNGFITFNDFTYARMWANTWIPDPGPTSRNSSYRYPNNAIYPYWDDLSIAPRSYGAVYTAVSGSAPNRVFVVEWRDVAGAGDGRLREGITFSVQLEETTNNITVIYHDVDAAYGYGYSATEGIENQAGTDGIQLGFNERGIIGNMQAYRFIPQPAPNITPCGGPTPTGTPPTNTPTRTPAPSTPTPTATVCTPGPGSWSPGAPHPTAVIRAVGVYYPPNGKFYTMGGRSSDSAGSDLRSPREYDPATNTWTVKSATYPDANVNNMAGGVLNVSGTPVIVTVGGSAAGGSTSVGRVVYYNPTTDTLTEVSTDPWPPGANNNTLPGGWAVWNNRLYILGGFTINVGMIDEIWEYDPARPAGSRWVQKSAHLPYPLGYIPATAINGVIYTAGGSDYQAGGLVDTDYSFKYDIATDSITTIANIPRLTAETVALNLNNEMWVLGGGRTSPNPSNEVDIYNPSTNTWRMGLPFVQPRRNFPAATDGTRIWLVGGYAPTTATDAMEIFTPGQPCPTSTPTPIATNTPTATNTPSAPSPTPTALVCEMNFSDVPPTNPFYIYIRCLYCRGILGGYSDGTFRPYNPTTRGQMSKIVANAAGILDPIPPGTQTYTDVPPSHPFWVYIERLSAHGIVGGYSDGTFRPDNWVTRGQMTKFASNAAGFSEPIPPGTQTYTDVPPTQTFYVYIERLSSRGIISGYQCGQPPAGPCDPQNRPWFLPDNTVTRGQTAKIVSNTFFPVNCAPRGR